MVHGFKAKPDYDKKDPKFMKKKHTKRKPELIDCPIKPLKGENWRQFNAFENFLLLGQDRKLTTLAKSMNRQYATLCNWSNKFKWIERCRMIDEKIMEKSLQHTTDKYLVEINNRHTQMYQEAQKKSMAHIGKAKPFFENTRDSIVGLDIAIKGEREVAGLNAQKMKMGVIRDGFAAWVEVVTKDERMKEQESLPQGARAIEAEIE
jgi:hypothetical protein